MKNIETKSRSRFFSGVMALTIGNLFVKVVGLILKIPLHDILGDSGMVYYGTAYEIYAWLFTVATTGLPTAISMMVSEDRTKGKVREIRKIFRITVLLFVIIGLAGMSVMLFGAPLFEAAYKIENSAYCIIAVAPTLFFICIASALRGYFQGYQNMYPTAISEVIEAIGKLVIGLLFATYAASKGYPLHIIAAYAALGLTIGVAAGMVYLIIAKLIFKPEKYDVECGSLADDNLEVRSARRIAYTLLAIAIPITLSGSVQSFATVIDGMILSNRLQDIGISQLHTKEIIGNYQTLAAPLTNLPPALITPITAAIIPLLSASIAQGNKHRTKRVMNGALMITAIIEIPCSLGMSVLAEPIIKLLFGDNASSEKAAPLLSVLSLAIFFSSVTLVTSCFLQAHKHGKKPVTSMIVGTLVKMISLYLLVGIKGVNIYGAPLSSILGGLAISACNLFFMKKHIGFVPDFKKMLIKPFISSLICAVSAMLFFKLLKASLGGNVAVLVAIALAVAVYTLAILLTRALSREDIMLLPKGEKICALLEKMHLIEAE